MNTLCFKCKKINSKKNGLHVFLDARAYIKFNILYNRYDPERLPMSY